MRPACRWRGRAVYLIEAAHRVAWVHDAGGFPCRDAESWALLDTMAEPVPVPVSAPVAVSGWPTW